MSNNIGIKFGVIDGLSDDYLPSCKTKSSAGLDIKTTSNLEIKPGEMVMAGTGVTIKECNAPIFMKLHLRSSVRFKLGIRYPLVDAWYLRNLPFIGYELDESSLDQLGTGIIDSDYPGEIRILCYNTTKDVVHIKKGDRIGQLVICENLTQKYAAEYCEDSERTSGIGSTNK